MGVYSSSTPKRNENHVILPKTIIGSLDFSDTFVSRQRYQAFFDSFFGQAKNE